MHLSAMNSLAKTSMINRYLKRAGRVDVGYKRCANTTWNGAYSTNKGVMSILLYLELIFSSHTWYGMHEQLTINFFMTTINFNGFYNDALANFQKKLNSQFFFIYIYIYIYIYIVFNIEVLEYQCLYCVFVSVTCAYIYATFIASI